MFDKKWKKIYDTPQSPTQINLMVVTSYIVQFQLRGFSRKKERKENEEYNIGFSILFFYSSVQLKRSDTFTTFSQQTSINTKKRNIGYTLVTDARPVIQFSFYFFLWKGNGLHKLLETVFYYYYYYYQKIWVKMHVKKFKENMCNLSFFFKLSNLTQLSGKAQEQRDPLSGFVKGREQDVE